MNAQITGDDSPNRQTMVIAVQPDELTHWIDSPAQPVLIEFYASWCIYHLLTKNKLEQLRASLGENVLVGSIDSLGNEDLLHKIGIHQIPSIGYFHGTTRILWHGDTDLELMLEHINKSKTHAELS